MSEYLIESTFCLTAFYLLYKVMFSHTRYFQINRFLLLGAVLLSLFLPLIQVPIDSQPIQKMAISQYVLSNGELSSPGLATMEEVNSSSQGFSIISILQLIYLLGLSFFLGRFLLNLWILGRKFYKAETLHYKGYKVVLLDREVGPYTFFNRICIHRTAFQKQLVEEELIRHEMAHIDYSHTLDLVLIELIQAFFWFQPLIYLFKREIKINHEYQADSQVLRSGISSQEYAHKLLQYTFPEKMSGLVSGFNHVLIKNRLIMLSKFEHKKPLAYRFLLLVPFISVLFLTTAFTEALAPNGLLTHIEADPLTEPGVVQASSFTWSEEDQKVYFRGTNMRVKHGDNNATVSGSFSYLGAVNYLVFNQEPVQPNVTVSIDGLTCQVVKLDVEDARKKYGPKGAFGAVEITVVP